VKLAGLSLALALIASGCTTDQSLATCQRQAKTYGQAVTVAGAVSANVQAVRDLQPNLQPPRWPELAADSQAYICYLNGPFGDAPGGGQPYDRAVVAVAADQADIVILGYADEMPIPTR
jgi:hypothetical protein